MPVEYLDLKDSDTSFELFVWECARGNLPHTKDLLPNAELPKGVKASQYSHQRLLFYRRELERLQQMRVSDANVEAEREYQSQLQYLRQKNANTAEKMRRHEMLLEKTQAWNPPTPEHYALKEFMLSLLFEWLHWDRIPQPSESSLRRLEGAAWKELRLIETREDLRKAELEWQEELAKTAKINDWLRSLSASVPPPAAPVPHHEPKPQ